MIGTQPVGTIGGVVISAVSHEGLRVNVDGKPSRLAIISDDGRVVAIGDQVAKEAEAVALTQWLPQLPQGPGLPTCKQRSYSERLVLAPVLHTSEYPKRSINALTEALHRWLQPTRRH